MAFDFSGFSNPFFSTQQYGVNPYQPFASGFPTTPIGDIYLNRVTERPAYNIYTSPFGGGFDPFSTFVQNAYGRARTGYESQLAYDPNRRWTDYLQDLGGESFFRNQWNNLSPQQRGQNPSMFVPPARWQLR